MTHIPISLCKSRSLLYVVYVQFLCSSANDLRTLYVSAEVCSFCTCTRFCLILCCFVLSCCCAVLYYVALSHLVIMLLSRRALSCLVLCWHQNALASLPEEINQMEVKSYIMMTNISLASVNIDIPLSLFLGSSLAHSKCQSDRNASRYVWRVGPLAAFAASKNQVGYVDP